MGARICVGEIAQITVSSFDMDTFLTDVSNNFDIRHGNQAFLDH